MNYETGIIRDDQVVLDYEGQERRAKRRRWIIIGAVVLVALLVAFMLLRPKAAPPADAGKKQAPSVTVVVPGRQTVDSVVSANGNLGARREMPVGVAGEGGMVARVLVEPGQWVGAGQVLATIDRRVQTQQAASLGSQIAVAQADARLAQANLERAQALVKNGFISKAQIDQLTATRDAANARARVAGANYQQSLASNSRLDIRAPAAGLVLERRVEPGQIVSAGSGMLFRMAKGGEMEMLARLGEADLARMHTGLAATVTPVGSTDSIKGQVWQVSPVIDPQTRQGIVRIAVPYSGAIRPGGFAEAKIVGGVANVPLLPQSAVQSDDKGNYVYIVDGNNKVVRRDVKVGDVGDSGVTIMAGLSGQERVVLSAGAFLNPGETVVPQRAKL
ncbi:MAG TPA: efflux RND transporter periplasmic adaptor subunit [Sphingomonas sp.]|jgi:RND family efflux transporter MFP subunit|nr:efflux RND transporter periplasmic adaptor subunit [Sphingomonas sp.]